MENTLFLLIALLLIAATIPTALLFFDRLKIQRFRKNVKPGDYCSTEHGDGRIEEIKGDTFIVSTWEGEYQFPRNKVYP